MEVSADRIERLSPAKRALLAQWRHSLSQCSAPTIPRLEPGAVAPLSFAQERLWFLDQLAPGNPSYNVATALRLKGALNAGALERAIVFVIDRHDALRTTFPTIDGLPRQVVTASTEWSLACDDLRATAAGEREKAWHELASVEALAPFDLAKGPLVRGRLVTLDRDDHVLLLTLHHIVCDGWSMSVFRAEVAEYYASIVENRSARLDPLEIQYPDYAAWQREELAGANLQRQLEYWTSRLIGLEGPLDLPLDFPRPAEQTFRGDVVRLRLDPALTEQVRRVARDEEATLFMVLLAAFDVLMSRFSGQRDLCVGSPVANRNHLQLERLIGFFVNTIVLRADLSQNPTIGELIAQARQTTLDAYAHQELPFARLVEALEPQRDLSRTPIFQVMLVLQNVSPRAQQVAGLSAEEASFDHAGTASFDLTLNVSEHQHRLELSFVYNTALFEPRSIDALAECYRWLLTEFCGDRSRHVLTLPLGASDGAAAHEIVEHRPSAKSDLSVHELIADQARRNPQLPAIVFGNESVSYAQLDTLSNQLASHLVAQGIGPDSVVGLCLPRSPDLIVAMLAILKAGGAYLPLDQDYPAARLEYMVRDAGVSLLLTTSGILPRLGSPEVATVLMDADCAAIAANVGAPLPKRSTSRNLAYLIYTSGSSGLPKGVEVEHRGLANHSRQIAARVGLGPGDRMLQFLSPSFDAAAEEIFPTLTSGAALCLHPAPAELSGAALLDWSRSAGVNVLHVTPPIWLSLLEELSAHSFETAAHLKSVIAGGESVRRADALKWRQVTSDRIPFFLAYGVTEATITTTLFDAADCDRAAPTASTNLPIGRPLPNTRIYVLDEFCQPVPAGVRGEIYIGGVGVASGYRRRPELDEQRFFADPFDSEPGARMYRTGDAGRFLRDGNVEFLGRLDRQVKVRGYRIEPGEIEALLGQCPGIREAAVVARPAGGSARLLAFAAVDDDHERGSTAEIEHFLRERLPVHMVPAVVIELDGLPHLPNGKIDYLSLAAIETVDKSAQSKMPPRTEVEQVLATIWAGVLAVDAVGVHDNYFELGGDSIRSIQVVARARDAGLRFTPKQLFEHQTIAELAQVAERVRAVTAEQGPVMGPAALTPIQQEFFALELADIHHFNQSVLFEVRTDLSATTLDTALRALVAHHDALRLQFVRDNDGAWQQSGGAIVDEPILQIRNLSDVDDSSIAAAIAALATEAQRSIDLAASPLLRGVYFDLGESRRPRLLLAIHHLAVDAVSWRILLEDLTTLCYQFSAGTAPQLPPKTTSFAEWGRRLSAFAETPEVAAEQAAWLAIGESSHTGLTVERIRSADLVEDEGVVEVTLSAEATRRWLHESHRAYRTRPHELLIAALVEMLAEHDNRSQVRIDFEGHGREDLFDDVDLSRTIGWLTTLFPCQFDKPAGGDARALITSVKERLRGINHGGLAYGLLRWMRRDAETRRSLASIPRARASFNYLGQLDDLLPPDGPFALAAESAGQNRSPHGQRPHEWEIIAYVRSGQLHVAWHFGSKLDRAEVIAGLARDLLVALERLIEHCLDPSAGAATPSDFPFARLDQADLDQLSALLGDDEGLAE